MSPITALVWVWALIKNKLRGAQNGAAQLEDHGPRAARAISPVTRVKPKQHREPRSTPDPTTGATRVKKEPERPPDPDIRITPLRVDTASWEMLCAGPEWDCWSWLLRSAKTSTAVEWVDVFGEVISLAIDRGAPGSGEIVLHTGSTRLAIRRARAEVQITALASEVEGLESWGLRWLPRVAGWLYGVEIEADGWRELGDRLHAIGVKTRRIEPCVDVIGWSLEPGDERSLVSKASKQSWWRDDGGIDGFGAGERSKTPASIMIYDKVAKLASQRGPIREALLARLRDVGWVEGEPVTRIEPRLWGPALLLEGLDASHPGAPFDADLLGRLWVDSLTRHRLVDLDAPAKRKRDRPDLAVWERARAAGGSAEPVRLRRDVAARQLAAVEAHAMRRLGRAGAEVETLLHGEGDGQRAVAAMAKLIAGPDWSSDCTRARARHAELLEQSGGEL